MGSEYPSVSVVVPVYNGEANIGECIESLLGLDYPESKYEVIVVDNDSTDNTAEEIRKHQVKYFLEKKRGSYAARNSGVRESRGEIIAFTDSDCVVDKKWLRKLVDGFAEGVGGVGGEITALDPKTPAERFLGELYSVKQATEEKHPFIITANAAYRKNVLHELGGFDESFTSGGDVDFSYRLAEKGYRIVYCPEAVVNHKHRSTYPTMLRLFVNYGVGNVKLAKKHAKTLNFKSRIYLKDYLRILENIFVAFPHRILTSPNKEDRSHYINEPICIAVQLIGHKLGLIYGSLKYGVIYF